MKIVRYVLVFSLLLVTNCAFCWWWGGTGYSGYGYTPSYQGGGGGGYITPSRFAPIGYTKNTGWDSGDSECRYQTVQGNGEFKTVRVVPVSTPVRIIQK